jgi:hypothetical protein
MEETKIIKILTYRLPFELSSPIFNEYKNRLTECVNIIEKYKKYRTLKEDNDAIEALLAISIFHKRVIANLDSVLKFYGTVHSIGDVEVIKMGSYNFDFEEKKAVEYLTSSYRRLLEKFNIHPSLFHYNETREFLQKLIFLKETTDDKKEDRRNRERGSQPEEDDFPF